MERLFLGLGEREVEASFIEALACDLWFQPNPESVLALSPTLGFSVSLFITVGHTFGLFEIA